MAQSATSLKGKVCLVTGATAGIGQAVASGFAQRGATVVLVGRDAAKGAATAAAIKAATGHNDVHVLVADLASQASIRQLAATCQRQFPALHCLVNSAAVFKSARTLSPDGLELMFATNHLAYFLLAHLLLDRLTAGAPASIFNVTAPSTVRLDFDNLQGQRKFNALTAFGATKMANLLFTFALARRLAGTGVVVNAYHPGVTRSGLMREAPVWMRWALRLANRWQRTPEQAAAGLVELAARHADEQSGQLFHDLKAIPVSAYAYDEAVQTRLWTISERLTGLAAV